MKVKTTFLLLLGLLLFRYTLFKTSGAFVENRTRPEGVFEEGMWAIKFFNDHFYIGGIDSRTSGVQAQATADDQISLTNRVFLTKDAALAVLSFVNIKPGWHDRRGDDSLVDHYVLIVDTRSEQLVGMQQIPGPLLAKDGQDRFYIRLSNVPDRRILGVFELVS